MIKALKKAVKYIRTLDYLSGVLLFAAERRDLFLFGVIINNSIKSISYRITPKAKIIEPLFPAAVEFLQVGAQ